MRVNGYLNVPGCTFVTHIEVAIDVLDFVLPHFQVLSPVRSVVVSLMTPATGRGTSSAHMEAKESGPAWFVGNQ